MGKGSFEEILDRDGRLVYTNVGDSMMPLIRQGRDLLVIEKPEEWRTLSQNSRTIKLKRYDIPLYKRDGGRVYVLHRVLAVRHGEYVLCGDNRWSCEYGITDRHVIGILTAVIRNGREIPLSGWKYGLYVFLWCRLFPLRALILRGLYLIRHGHR